MTEPAERVSVHEAMSRVMASVRAVAKDSLNRSQGAGYKFRGIDAVMNAVGPALREHGVTVVPHRILSLDYVPVVVGEKRTPMTSVRVRVIYRWRGPLGDKIDTEVPGEAFDAGDKGTAKAMSVAYRTLLLQALTLPTDDPDPDSHSYARAETDNPEMQRDMGRWRGEVAAAGVDEVKLRALWERMRAEWDTVPWSNDRWAELEPAIDRAKAASAARAAQAEQGSGDATPAQAAPEAAAEGQEPGDADELAQQAAEWDAGWRAQLEEAKGKRDAAKVRALVKIALESNARHLAGEGNKLLAEWRKESKS